MPTDDAVAVAIWAGGLLLVLAGLLVTIGRLAVYRHAGTFTTPWRRGVAPLLAGFALLSVSMYLLGLRGAIVRLWLTIGVVALVAALVVHHRRSRRRA